MSCSLIFLLTDATPFSRAIVGASAQGNLPLDHVGILDNDTQTVIEANAKEGVVETPLADFLARTPQLDGDAGYRIRNIPPEAEVDGEAALRRARSFLGYAYNVCFVPHAGALYCSELVQRACLKSDGEPYFSSIRLNFDSDDPAASDFWQQHFKQLDMPVPQGEPGTSPLSIYQQTEDPQSCLRLEKGKR